jgi:hypothetical protein
MRIALAALLALVLASSVSAQEATTNHPSTRPFNVESSPRAFAKGCELVNAVTEQVKSSLRDEEFP